MPLSRHQKINKQNKFRTSFFKTSALLLYHITSRINLAFCVPMYSLACYSPWTGKESDTTERLNWTERYSFQVKVKVSQSFLTLCDPMDCIVHGILQARILEWVAFPFSRVSSQPRDRTLQEDSLPAEPQGKPGNTGVGSLSLLQGIFLTQELNWGLLHCRRILYQLSYQQFSKVMYLTFPLCVANLQHGGLTTAFKFHCEVSRVSARPSGFESNFCYPGGSDLTEYSSLQDWCPYSDFAGDGRWGMWGWG